MNATVNAVKATIVPDFKEADLNADLKKHACEAIEKAYDIHWGKGGINDTTEKLKGLQGKVGEQVYAIAKDAIKYAGNSMAIAKSMFLALCAYAEKHLKAKYVEEKGEEATVGKLVPQWSQYKTDIAKGLEKGIDPEARTPEKAKAYPTAASYREAARKANGGATGSQAGQQRENSSGSLVLQLQGKQWGMNPVLAAAIHVMASNLARLDHQEQASFAAPILNIAKDAEKLFAEASGLEESAARTPEQEVANEVTEALGGVGQMDQDVRLELQDILNAAGIGQPTDPVDGKPIPPMTGTSEDALKRALAAVEAGKEPLPETGVTDTGTISEAIKTVSRKLRGKGKAA